MSIGPWPAHSLVVRPAERDDVFLDVVRVAQKYRPFSRAGQIIIVHCRGKRLIAAARGIRRNEHGVISLDLESRRRLDVELGEEAEFTFEAADFFEELVWAWNATNAMPRVAARLGIVGLLLGLIGLFLGCVSLVK